jgi:RHS repeat-associated protein
MDLRITGRVVRRWNGQYNIFRWYRAGWGRYTQADPIGLEGGLHFYTYAGDDPINFVDPAGLKTYPVNFFGPLQPGDTRSYAANMNDPEIEAMTLGFQATRSFYPAGTSAKLQGECVSLTKFFSRVPCITCWRGRGARDGKHRYPGDRRRHFRQRALSARRRSQKLGNLRAIHSQRTQDFRPVARA